MMDKLQQQVRKARGRLNFQTFLGVFAWSLFGWLVAAAVALAVPKIWALGLGDAAATYTWSIALGGLFAGLATAGIWTWLKRRGDLDAALELDQRFGLRERVSSTLALSPEELQTEAGQALLNDAVRRAERIDVRDRFGVQANWLWLLSLAPAIAVAVLVVVPNAVMQKKAAAAPTNVAAKTQIKTAQETLKREAAKMKKEAEERGLQDAEAMFDKLENGLDGLHEKTAGDRKKAMVELNNLAKQLKDRQKRLQDADEIRKQMNGLNDLKKGPADKLADALKDGDFNKAADEMKKLQEKLEQGGLNKEEQKQLQAQMEQMQQKLQQLADAHEQAKQDLKEQIEKAKQAGDLAKAGDLQRKLDDLTQNQPAMDKLQQMANQLGQAAQNMQQGDQQAAAEQLAQLQQQLDDLQQMEDEMQMLDQAMDQIADAKNAMNCPHCHGEGCQFCQGQGKKDGQPGRGRGEGQGRGDRPVEENDTDSYASKVRGPVGPGEAYVVGKTGGANKAGDVREQIKDSLSAAGEGNADPLTNQRLPRKEHDHVKEYFEAFSQGD